MVNDAMNMGCFDIRFALQECSMVMDACMYMCIVFWLHVHLVAAASIMPESLVVAQIYSESAM
jgi:hypothetical protein